MRASGVQLHTESDTSNRFVQTLGESDTDSIVGMSEQGVGVEVIDATPAEVPVAFIPRATQYSDAFASLDGVSLRDVFDSRAVVMQSVPFFLRGAFRGAVRVSLQAILRGYEQRSELRITRGWKLFMLLPRLLLFRPRKGGKVPKKALEERFQFFQEGRWLELLAFCRESAKSISLPSDAAAAQRQDHGIQRRVDRAHNLVHLGGVVCCTSSPGRCQRCAGNDGHIERTDKPGSLSACGKTCTEPRDLAIRTSGGSSIGWGGFPHVSEDRQERSCGRSVWHDC